MNEADQAKALRLFEVLFGRPADEQEDLALVMRSRDLAAFRVVLGTATALLGEDAQTIRDTWRMKLQQRIDFPSGNTLMHALEKLREGQRSIDDEVLQLNRGLIAELVALDAACVGVAELRNSLNTTSRRVQDCRASLSSQIGHTTSEQ